MGKFKLGRNEKCLCGSGIKYKYCCMGKQDEPETNINLTKKSQIDKMIKAGRFKHCIHPDQNECSENIIKAHSIQHNKILNNLSRDGMLIMFNYDFNNNNDFFINYKLIGKKNSTTFTGFCGKHDKITFQPIEDENFVGDDKQNFLFAYKAFAYEFHKKLEQLNAYQVRFKTKPSLATDLDFYLNYYGVELGLNDLVYYKEIFDKSIIENDYSKIETFIIKFKGSSKIAVCTGFILEYDLLGSKLIIDELSLERQKLIFLNLFPQNDETFVLFSWLKEDTEHYINFKNQLLGASEKHQISILNNLIPSYSQNTVINPEFFDKLTDIEKDNLTKVFNYNFDDNNYDLIKKNLIIDSNYNLFKNLKI